MNHITNKYNLTVSKIKKLKIGDRSKINRKNGFWRNDVIKAWCISKSVGQEDLKNSFWLGFYDEDAPAYAGKFRISVDSYDGMCNYIFNQFFQEKDIECPEDLKIQKMLLDEVTRLIDEGILVIQK